MPSYVMCHPISVSRKRNEQATIELHAEAEGGRKDTRNRGSETPDFVAVSGVEDGGGGHFSFQHVLP